MKHMMAMCSREWQGNQKQKRCLSKKCHETTHGHDMLPKFVVVRSASHADSYLADQEGGNHSHKTLEWHRTALGLLKGFLARGAGISRWSERLMRPISTPGLFTCARLQAVTARSAANAPFRLTPVQHAPFATGSCDARSSTAILLIASSFPRSASRSLQTPYACVRTD